MHMQSSEQGRVVFFVFGKVSLPAMLGLSRKLVY